LGLAGSRVAPSFVPQLAGPQAARNCGLFRLLAGGNGGDELFAVKSLCLAEVVSRACKLIVEHCIDRMSYNKADMAEMAARISRLSAEVQRLSSQVLMLKAGNALLCEGLEALCDVLPEGADVSRLSTVIRDIRGIGQQLDMVIAKQQSSYSGTDRSHTPVQMSPAAMPIKVKTPASVAKKAAARAITSLVQAALSASACKLPCVYLSFFVLSAGGQEGPLQPLNLSAEVSFFLS
jgi:hypothetical protein